MIYRAINGLIRHAIEADLITNDDIFVVRNQLMDILKLTIIRYEVGRVFEQVLEDAGVFKRDKQGKEAFARFVEQLG